MSGTTVHGGAGRGPALPLVTILRPVLQPFQAHHKVGSKWGRCRFAGKKMVGVARFELATPSPPDWCANQAAPHADRDPEV